MGENRIFESCICQAVAQGFGIPLGRKINCESEKVVSLLSPFSFRVIDQIMGSFPHSLIFRIPLSWGP